MIRKSFVLTALAGLVMCAGAQAQISPQARHAEVDTLMQRYASDIPGASLLVVKNGKAIIRRGYGYANLEKHVKTTPATNYRLASMSKQFT
ncbi:MAG TPA: serine hydrolase, partial [Oleiagrimonas sp.]|nr:serine hydrolase [Oleiagrimonas sp.]